MIDFQKITRETDLYNLHTHTQYCDGHAPMEEFVTEAIAMGFTHLGFTPHSPVSVESPCNMTREQVSEYFDEINRLRSVYGDRINLYTSMEIDYLSVGDGPADEYFRQLPLDFRIGSVHFIPAIDNPGEMVDIDGKFPAFKARMTKHFDCDIVYVVKTFFSQMMAMVEEGGFDIVGHMDKIGFNASQYLNGIDEEPWYDKLVIDLFENIMDPPRSTPRHGCSATASIPTSSTSGCSSVSMLPWWSTATPIIPRCSTVAAWRLSSCLTCCK